MGANSYPAIQNHPNLFSLSKVRVRAVVVDDTKEIIVLATQFLEADGNIEVVGTAANGVEGVAMVRMFDPDLVLMDINMPAMNGLTAALRIRELRAETKILLMSSDDNPDLGLAALDCGADGFNAKHRLIRELPLHLERLFPARGLSRWVGRKSIRLVQR